MPVILLQGSDYDMGYQYFQQVHGLFGPSRFQAMQRPGGFTDEQIMALKAYQWYVVQYTPEYVDMFKGMAAAATDLGIALSYTEVLANYVGTTAYPGSEPEGSGDDTLPPSCSAWAAWGRTTTDGGLIAGQEMDHPSGSTGTNEYVAIVAYPATGNAYINVTEPAALTSIPVMPGMNNKGVSTTGNLGGAWRDIDYGPGAYRVKTGLIAHILRFANSAAEARDLWLSYQQPGVWNATISDVKGDAFVVESTAAFQNVRKPGDFGEGDFIHSRNSFFTEGDASLNGLPGVFYPHGGWALDPIMDEPPDSQGDMQMASVRTNQTMYNMFSQYAGRVDLEFAKMLWRYHGVIPSDPFDVQAFRETKAKYFGNPGNLEAGFVTIAQPSEGNGGAMYVCTGMVGRVGVPYCAGTLYEDTYWIANTRTFYRLALGANPNAMVNASQATAQRSIAWAYQKLMWKYYGDEGFGEMDGLFSQAVREFLEGNNWTRLARKASGNQKVLDMANAATCYTNAQAHAEQVYEAVVRPAVTPLDLGLKKYKAISYGF